MEFQYKERHPIHFDCNVKFWGQEQREANQIFEGNNIRQEYVLHYVISGKGIFSSSNHKVAHLKAGDVFILPKDVPCFYQADEEDPWSYFWIGFTGTSVEQIVSLSSLSVTNFIHNVDGTNFEKSLKELYSALHENDSPLNSLLVLSHTYSMFYYLLHDFPGKKKFRPNRVTELYSSIELFIKNYYSKNINISDICTEFSISRGYLNQIFSKCTNISPQEYLMKIRMEKAKRLLYSSDYSVQTISSMVGYNDPFTFSKAFKKYSQVSPSKYRKNIQQ